jgi:hypothetical protein
LSEHELATVLQKKVKSFTTAYLLCLTSSDLDTQNQALGFLEETIVKYFKSPGKEMSQALERALSHISEMYLSFGREIADIDGYCRALNLISKLAGMYCILNFNFENSSVLGNLIRKLVEECKLSYREPSQSSNQFIDTSTIPDKIVNILLRIVKRAIMGSMTSAIPDTEIKVMKELLSHILKNQYDIYDIYPRSLYENAKRLLNIIRKLNAQKLN